MVFLKNDRGKDVNNEFDKNRRYMSATASKLRHFGTAPRDCISLKLLSKTKINLSRGPA